MIKKIGKEIDLVNDNESEFKIRLGTVDNKQPKSLYINIISWIEPTETNLSHKTVIKNLNKNIKKFLFKNINKNFFNNKRVIVDLDIRESGLNLGKKSYMSCEITLYQTNTFKIQEKDMTSHIKKLSNLLIKGVFNEDSNLKYQKNKK